MSDVGGLSLETQLRFQANVAMGRLHLVSMRNIGRALGGWLRTFQDVTAAPTQPHNHRNYLQRFDEHLSRTRQFGVSPTALRHVRDRAEAISASRDGTPMCVASAHGDFLPRISFSTDRDPELSILPRIARKRRSTGTRHHLPDTSAPGEQKEIFKQSPWGFNSTFFREYEKNLDPSLLRIFGLKTMLQTIRLWSRQASIRRHSATT